ncbi:MAG: DNA repair protein RecN [Thermodesulfovibrionales bacterium]
MLRELKIKNLAIIDDLSLRFEKGLNVLTGETGAGKSIIVDALGLSLGARAQADMIKSGATEATVQAFFEVEDCSLPAGLDLECTDGLVLRRVLSSSGKSRAYINDTMVTLQTLSDVGKSLVDILSQHEHQSLLSPEKQTSIVDGYGRLFQEKETVASLFADVQNLRQEVRELTLSIQDRARRLDLLRYQISEIDAADLRPDEKAGLEEERNILANLGRLNELAETAYAALYESDGSCSEKLALCISKLQEIRSIDPAIDEALTLLESAAPLVQDAAHELRRCRDRYDPDPARLETIEDRLELIKNLGKKYGNTIRDILSYRDKSAQELKELESSDDRLASLEQALVAKESALLAAASALSEKRKKVCLKIDQLIEETLRDLAFGTCRFHAAVRTREDGEGRPLVQEDGMDIVEFLFSANPGEPMKPLSKIASGGELSRVMLALKSILADADNIPVLILDEVDAGIGGKTAESVGKKLDSIAGKRQLLCITHLPQIARFGSFHLKIEKKLRNQKVHVEVQELTGRKRQDEIARMLSGDITDISRKHAGELLEKTK